MRVDSAGSEYMSFTRQYFGAGTNNNIDTALSVGVAGFTYGEDASIFDTYIGFDYSPVINNDGIGDH